MKTKFEITQKVYFLENNQIWKLPVKQITHIKTAFSEVTKLSFDFVQGRDLEVREENCFETKQDLFESLEVMTTIEDELPF